MEFIYLFLFRTLSGWQNGCGYAIRHTGSESGEIWYKMQLLVITFLLGIGALSQLLWLGQAPTLFWKITTALLCSVSIVGVFGVYDSFEDDINFFPRDIHFWELVCTTGVTLGWVTLGGNLFLIAAHVYPALLLHKGAVNIGSGLPFWDHRTDDATGATFSIPLLGLRIPRLSAWMRQVLAVGSLIGAGLCWWYGWSFTIYNL